MVDPHLGTDSARSTQGPLPALNAVTNGPPGSSLAAEMRAKREQSASPPRSSHSESGAYNPQPRNSISSILHAHSAASGDYHSSNSSSNSAAPEQGGVSEDARALRMLDRSAFRQAAPVHAHG